MKSVNRFDILVGNARTFKPDDLFRDGERELSTRIPFPAPSSLENFILEHPEYSEDLGDISEEFDYDRFPGTGSFNGDVKQLKATSGFWLPHFLWEDLRGFYNVFYLRDGVEKF